MIELAIGTVVDSFIETIEPHVIGTMMAALIDGEKAGGFRVRFAP